MREENEQASELARQRMNELLSNLGSTLDDMKTGLASAASQMGVASAQAANDAARIGQAAMEKSFSEFVERFNQVGGPLVGSMKDAGAAISSSADELSTAQGAIGDHARAIELVAARSSDLATAFGTVANDVEAAVTPVRQSAASISWRPDRVDARIWSVPRGTIWQAFCKQIEAEYGSCGSVESRQVGANSLY